MLTKKINGAAARRSGSKALEARPVIKSLHAFYGGKEAERE